MFSTIVWSPAVCVILSSLPVSIIHPALCLFLLSRFQKLLYPSLFNSLPLCSSLFSFSPSSLPKLCPTHTSNSFQADIQTFVDSHLETAFSSGWVSGSFHTSRLINLQTCRPPKQERGQEGEVDGGGGRTDRGMMGRYTGREWRESLKPRKIERSS